MSSPRVWCWYGDESCHVMSFQAGPFLDRRVVALFVPAIAFVALYSYLPHKASRGNGGEGYLVPPTAAYTMAFGAIPCS